jgi:nitrate/nitrite transporter NarK
MDFLCFLYMATFGFYVGLASFINVYVVWLLKLPEAPKLITKVESVP